MRGRVFVRSRVAVGLRACLRLCEVCAEAACSASVTAVGEKEPAFVGQPPVEPVLQASPGILAEFRRASGAAVDAKSDGSCIRIIVRLLQRRDESRRNAGMAKRFKGRLQGPLTIFVRRFFRRERYRIEALRFLRREKTGRDGAQSETIKHTENAREQEPVCAAAAQNVKRFLQRLPVTDLCRSCFGEKF